MMHGHGKSDSSIVPEKPPNEAEPEAKEVVEGRELAKGNQLERNMSRTQSRTSPEISAKGTRAHAGGSLALSWRSVSAHGNTYPQQKRFQLSVRA